MTYALPIFPPGFRVSGSDGLPSPGAVLRFYTAGTSSPLTVYSNAAGTSSLGTSVTCDADGYPANSGSRVNVYTSASSFKIAAEDADGALLWTHDNITGVLDTSAFLTTPSTEIELTTLALSTTTTLTAAQLVNRLITGNPGGGSFVITLPSVSGDAVGVPFDVMHIGSSGVLTIKSAGTDPMISDGIDTGRRAVVLMQKGDHARIVSDGVSWNVLTSPILAPRSFAVESQLTSPPTSPTAGLCYLLNGTPSGAFTSTTPACAQHDVVMWDGTGWHIYRPTTDCGWTAYDKDTNTRLEFRGSAWDTIAATDSAAGILQRATQAEMETATAVDRAVVPGRMQYHPGMAKAWVVFQGTGTVTILTSHNVSSVTDNGTGDYTVNFTTAFSSANYIVTGTGRYTTAGQIAIVAIKSDSAPTASACRLLTFGHYGGGSGVNDLTSVHVAFFGDQ